MPTTWETDRDIQTQEIVLSRGDLDDDVLQWSSQDDDTILVSTSNETTWTARTPI